MKSDKDLMREGRYQEALGNNYSVRPYSLLDMTNKSNPVNDTEFYATKEQAQERAKELEWTNFIIFNLNADWR